MTWNKDEIGGKADQLKGKVKQGMGDLTGDERLRSEGEADEVGGEVREGVGTVRRKAGEAVEKIGESIKR